MIIKINAATQQLQLLQEDGAVHREYVISTGKNGLGEVRNSEQTPRGWHQIRAKIGGGLPTNAVLVARRFTNEIYSTQLAAQLPARDWILTRILWLSGLEKGFNRLGVQDTMARYIYIHGCPDHCQLGVPLSHGCIRMRNHDIIELYDLVSVGTRVLISER